MAKTDLANKSRSYLTKKLNSMEIPETDSRDYDTEHIKEILIFQAPDMFYDSREEAKVKKRNGIFTDDYRIRVKL
jgi:hypothetical protein